jgi:hypothetical protein
MAPVDTRLAMGVALGSSNRSVVSGSNTPTGTAAIPQVASMSGPTVAIGPLNQAAVDSLLANGSLAELFASIASGAPNHSPRRVVDATLRLPGDGDLWST